MVAYSSTIYERLTSYMLTEGSTGTHGDGVAERSDIVAALGIVTDAHPELPVVLCGYSFGADVALSVTDERIAGWFLVAPPFRVLPPADMAAGKDRRPKTIVSGTEDDLRPVDQVIRVTED